MKMTSEELKRILWSIIIGASVAFVTKLLEGLFNFVNGWLLDNTGTAVSMVYYLKHHYRTTIS